MRKIEKERKEQNQIKKAKTEKDNAMIQNLDIAIVKMLNNEKENLPNLLEQRKLDLINDLKLRGCAIEKKDSITIQGNNYLYQEVIDNIFRPIINWRHKEAEYSALELHSIFEVFIDLCKEIKKKEPSFTPTLDTFLYFSDVGIETFRKYQRNELYRPTCDKIYAFIGMSISDAGLRGNANNRVVTFLEERDLGKQTLPPITVIGEQYNNIISAKDREELREKIKNMN